MALPSPFSRPRARALLLAALMLSALGAGTATRAQQQPTPTPDDVITVESNLVQLNVGVVDQTGRAVTTLSRNDFVVYEDGVRQTISNFEPTQAPFSVVILLDLSGSTLAFRQQLKMAAVRFLDALGPEDRVSVVAFWSQRRVKEPRSVSHVETLSDFTTDRRKLIFALTDRVPNGSGDTNLYEGLRRAMSALAKEGKRRKAIVVLTDGIDTALSAEDRAATISAKTGDEAVAAIKPETNATLNSLLSAADRIGVTIYPLALPSGDLKQLLAYNRQVHGAFPDDPSFGDPTPQQIAVYTAARARLDALANRTGGRLYAINRLEDLGKHYVEVAAEMRTLYSIAYQASGAKPRDGKWRDIRIEVARPELVARTKPGYYAR